MDRKQVPFCTLLGLTLVSVTGAEAGSEEVVLATTLGHRFHMLHKHDCCESVSIEDVEGDLNDLIGSPLVLAEEATSGDAQPGQSTKYAESFTWTFYRLATARGYVVLRWLGESNGYYSEAVDFEVLYGDFEVSRTDNGWKVLRPDGAAPEFATLEAAQAFAAVEKSNHR